jgi:hypothetical protein
MNWRDFTLDRIDKDPELVSSETLVERIRKWRNDELRATDFSQLADSPVDRAQYAAYRRALRDIPGQGDNPRLWTFPVRP